MFGAITVIVAAPAKWPGTYVEGVFEILNVVFVKIRKRQFGTFGVAFHVFGF